MGLVRAYSSRHETRLGQTWLEIKTLSLLANAASHPIFPDELAVSHLFMAREPLGNEDISQRRARIGPVEPSDQERPLSGSPVRVTSFASVHRCSRGCILMDRPFYSVEVTSSSELSSNVGVMTPTTGHPWETKPGKRCWKRLALLEGITPRALGDLGRSRQATARNKASTATRHGLDTDNMRSRRVKMNEVRITA